MPTSYTKEQVGKVYEKLPEELREALFAIETTEAIGNACIKHKISDLSNRKITEYIGYVLLGLVLPQDFEQLLQKDLKVPKKVAQEIAREINRFVFYPVKSALEQLHNVQITPTSKTLTSKTTSQKTEQLEPPQKSSGPDIYQESLEEE